MMGLDTSHGCWHGAYSAFMRWRQELAKVAGYPPLQLMEGFYSPDEFWCFPAGGDMHRFPTTVRADPAKERSVWSFAAEQALAALPIKWDLFEHDPLVKLLYHSDCGGKLDAVDCGPIADRLAELLPKLPEGDGGGHIGDWREKTQKFIDGLRLAASLDEEVTFS